MRTPALTLALVLVVGACADGSDDTSDGDASPGDEPGSAVIVTTTSTTSTTPSPTASTEPTELSAPATTEGTGADITRPPDSTVAPATTTPETTTTVGPTVGDPAVTSEVVVELRQPVDLAVRPGDDALYIVEQPGRVVRFDGGEATVVADLTDLTDSEGEQGLLGLAFAPDGRLAYVNYTDGAGDTVVAEYEVAGDGRFATDRVLITIDQPYSNHNGGHLAVGPDSMLYIAMGDGGSANDPERRASDPTSWLGSLLRVDPTPAGGLPYSIPPDNPFAGGDAGGVAGAPEVWAWGLRNPWKIAFDPVTDDLWIADVGQNEIEEVNRVTARDGMPAGRAADFGWSAFEGTERFNTDIADTGNTVFPVLTYRHGSDGCSISGGVPYRGSAIAELAPAYVYSDLCSGIVWALDLEGGRNLTLLDGFERVTAVRAGPDGELYVLEHGGRVHRIVPA